MTRFDKAQLVTFIRSLDRNLEEPLSVVVIGGAAAAVGYDSHTKTADIDVFTNLSKSQVRHLSEAAKCAQSETGLAVGIGHTAVADLPFNYEDRLKPIRGLKLRKTTIFVPDKYDLALSKTMRGHPHDIEAIEGIHERHHLALKTLVDRFETELLGEAVADPRKICLNVAMVVARLYGFDEGKKLAERWKVPAPQRSRG
jgi:hypothetical protein